LRTQSLIGPLRAAWTCKTCRPWRMAAGVSLALLALTLLV